jgi:hypothetical protein
MKNMFLRLSIVFAFVLMAAVPSQAQNYRTALGVRLGAFNGITIKHFMKRDNALEGLLNFRWNGFIISGLYEYQKPFKGVNNLDWFVGIGGHVGFWDNGDYYWNHYRNESYTVFGMDLIGGIEYTFDEVPINLGLDWKPAFNFVGDSHVWFDGLALSIRYTFK